MSISGEHVRRAQVTSGKAALYLPLKMKKKCKNLVKTIKYMCIRISRRLNGVNKHSVIKEGERKEGDNTRETYTSRRNYSGTPKSKFKKCLEIQCHGLVDKGVISQAG